MSRSHQNNVASPWRKFNSVCGRMEGRIGDKGQRFEIRYKDGKGDEHVMGWVGTEQGARTMADAINKHPTWNSPRIVDRQPTEGPR